VRPALVVYNHAPTALLAARMAQCPVLLVGTGFEIPPATAPLPSFRPWQAIPEPLLHGAEAKALAQVNPHLARCGQAPLAKLSDLFPQSQVQLTTFAELDPFGPRPHADYIGPVHALPGMPAVAWQGRTAQRVFAYLRPGVPGCENLLAALQALDAEVICAAPGLPSEWQARHGRIRFLPHPVDLAALLPQADLAITYGAGTIATALLAGVPVLLAPQVVEQYLAGLPLERTGAGRMLRERCTPEQCTALLHELLTDARYREAARCFAQEHVDFSVEDALRRQWQAVARRLG
ncbi:MAG: UDP-glucuronosyltransferase, partial [Proteobacteria bacterium]|nr:UDP-glucuronosyltransferase [Pseudomonadota bacterium]